MRRLLLAAAGAVAARAALRALGAPPPLQRTNFRGRTVTLAAGPALAAAGSLTAAAGSRTAAAGSLTAAGAATRPAAAALIAGLGAGAVGLYDDLVGPRQATAKGFRGHLSALRQGRVTSGTVKIAGLAAAGLAASALLERPARVRRAARGVDVLFGAGVVAGTANLVNLLDLRPGRAVKAALLAGAPLLPGPAGGLVAGPLGAAAGILPADLGEQVMLGDCGANALGAQLGLALAARTGPAGRAALLAGLVALTAVSEKVSFTQVIARTPGLRELDELGRRRPAAASPAVAPDRPASPAVAPDRPASPAVAPDRRSSAPGAARDRQSRRDR